MNSVVSRRPASMKKYRETLFQFEEILKEVLNVSKTEKLLGKLEAELEKPKSMRSKMD